MLDFVLGGETHTVETRNVSLGGVFIATELKLEYGTQVALRIQLTPQSELIEVDAHVRWIENEAGRQVGLGLRFAALRARDIWALSKYLEETQKPEEG